MRAGRSLLRRKGVSAGSALRCYVLGALRRGTDIGAAFGSRLAAFDPKQTPKSLTLKLIRTAKRRRLERFFSLQVTRKGVHVNFEKLTSSSLVKGSLYAFASNPLNSTPASFNARKTRHVAETKIGIAFT